MEHIDVHLNEAEMFDKFVHGGLRECGDLQIVTKDKSTQSGRAIAVITFTVELPNGQRARVQATTSVRLLLTAGAILRGRYTDEGFSRESLG